MRVPILCYHEVAPLERAGRRLNVEPRRLAAHVGFFARQGRPFLRASELAADCPEGAVCFTFDDAYAAAVEHARPLFARWRRPATFFAVTDLVGGESAWDGALARPLADWDALREARAEGHEVGNHTARHLRLAELEPQAQRDEIVRARERLAAEGLASTSFCYPYGSVGPTTPAMLDELGYAVGLGLRKGLASPADDRRALPRVVVAYGDALPMLLYRLRVRPLLRRLGV